MKIYIHYNGLDLGTPEQPNDFWDNYEEVNMARMFLMSARSWELQGWEVQRIRGDEPGTANAFNFRGVLAKQAKFYPERFWNVWKALYKIAPCWTSVASVINYTFSREQAMIAQAPVHYGKALNLMYGFEWASPVFYVTIGFLDKFYEIVSELDAGRITGTPVNVYTDEHVIRDWMRNYVAHYWVMDNAYISTNYKTAALLHFPRSGVRRAMELYPVLDIFR
jgi:hypothetical protein